MDFGRTTEDRVFFEGPELVVWTEGIWSLFNKFLSWRTDFFPDESTGLLFLFIFDLCATFSTTFYEQYVRAGCSDVPFFCFAWCGGGGVFCLFVCLFVCNSSGALLLMLVLSVDVAYYFLVLLVKSFGIFRPSTTRRVSS